MESDSRQWSESACELQCTRLEPRNVGLGPPTSDTDSNAERVCTLHVMYSTVIDPVRLAGGAVCTLIVNGAVDETSYSVAVECKVRKSRGLTAWSGSINQRCRVLARALMSD